jgi:hypothetical protein
VGSVPDSLADVPPTAPHLLIRGQRIAVDSTPIMGVVNASPESFSDGGRFSSLEPQLERCAALVKAGADNQPPAVRRPMSGRPLRPIPARRP